MPLVDLADETFVVAPPAAVAAQLCTLEWWRRCWPDLRLRRYHDRGDEGARWYVSGALTGTAEVWLEPYRDGTVVHVFLRADPSSTGGTGARDGRTTSGRTARRESDRRTRALKRALFETKDALERTRAPGEPPATPQKAPRDRPADHG